jgi:hypothetical protein
MRLLLTIAIVALSAVSMAAAQTNPQSQSESREQQKSYLYQWTDDRGVVHVTDDLGTVPKKYRNKALRIEESTGGSEEAAQSQQQLTRPSRTESDDDLDQERKAEWQQRLKQARKRVADAQRRYQDLDLKRNELLTRWAGGASGNIGVKLEADRIEQEMKTVQQEIEDARNELENVIPDEARKAGVPPGWLRE